MAKYPVKGMPVPIGKHLYIVGKVGNKKEVDEYAKAAKDMGKFADVKTKKLLGKWTMIAR